MAPLRTIIVLIALMFVMLSLPGTLPAFERGRYLSTAEKEKLNANRIGIITGSPGGTYIQLANDLSALLDDLETLEMRVMGVIGRGSVCNIEDLLHLRGIDVAIVQDDVLDYLQNLSGYAGINRKLVYIARLYEEEIHILARSEVKDLNDLNGRVVNVGEPCSGSEMTARNLFRLLNIKVKERSMPNPAALQAMVSGQVAAMVMVGGKPLPVFNKISEADISAAGLHFLAIPHEERMLRGYGNSTLTAKDYSNLVRGNDGVPTRTVTAIMAVYNWQPSDGERYRATAAFVNRFFDRFPELVNRPGFVPKWKEVDLYATVPNWTRFQPAADWIEKHPRDAPSQRTPDCLKAFRTHLQSSGFDPSKMNQDEFALAYEDFKKNHPERCK